MTQINARQNVVMIDNYDSFTWNLYEYLSREGANVQVFRNDKISIAEIEALNPDRLIISPGPGHPVTDSGISKDAIKYFAGKIPVIGVCMGQQCIVSVFGGEVLYAGEIVHGKTSVIHHDQKGLFANVSQGISVTRYHSLAGAKEKIPDCLEVSAVSEPSGVIMGVRHKEYTVEGVQFHPESILTDEGRLMVRNFLAIQGGTWPKDESDHLVAKEKKQIPLDMLSNASIEAETGSINLDRAVATGCSANSAAELANQVNSGLMLSTSINETSSTIAASTTTEGQKLSILDQIFQRRKKDVELQKRLPGMSMSDLEKSLALQIAPPPLDFAQRLRSIITQNKNHVAVLAEVKRASPSNGPIGMHIHAATQALRYAEAGAAAISVLTEPHWFKGSINDLEMCRRVVDKLEASNNTKSATAFQRPAILRKEFVFDEYQILEARLAGADSVLLIVKMLNDELLSKLYKYSKTLGMEPLVEVASADEMQRATALGAKVIGVNNRDLHSFHVDLNTTSSLAKMVPEDAILIALSGIKSRKDVEPYIADNVRAVLVGEALMKAPNPFEFVQLLMGTIESH